MQYGGVLCLPHILLWECVCPSLQVEEQTFKDKHYFHH